MGRGLRAASHKVNGKRTPYVLNAIEVTSRLVIGHLAISEKTNEMMAIPKFVGILNIEGNTVTIDALCDGTG